MVTVAEELPFAAVVDGDKLDTVCSNCFALKRKAKKIDLKKCAKCRTVHYCSKAGCAPDDVRLVCRMIMRVKRGDLPVAFNGRTFDDLMNHKNELFLRDRKQDEVYSELLSFMGRGNVLPFKEFLPLYGKFIINSFGIYQSNILESDNCRGYAIYLGLSAHNHSCRPNAEVYFNGSKVLLRALDPNSEYSKNLTISYIPLLWAKAKRQDFLRTKYYFECNCERCMDEEIELWERSGKSNCCPEDGAVLPVDKKFLWYWQRPLVCTNCGKKADITLEQINDANNHLAKMCAMKEHILPASYHITAVDQLANHLKKMESILSPYNLYLLKFTTIVASVYATVRMDPVILGRFIVAEKRALLKYSYHTNISNPYKDLFDESDSITDTSSEGHDVVKEVYGFEHDLHKEITPIFVLIENLCSQMEKEEEKKTAKGATTY